MKTNIALNKLSFYKRRQIVSSDFPSSSSSSGVGGSFEKGGAEWFWLHSTNPHSISAKYLRDYFPPKFTYQDFGAMLTMEFFDAKEIAEMVRDAGAK